MSNKRNNQRTATTRPHLGSAFAQNARVARSEAIQLNRQDLTRVTNRSQRQGPQR